MKTYHRDISVHASVDEILWTYQQFQRQSLLVLPANDFGTLKRVRASKYEYASFQILVVFSSKGGYAQGRVFKKRYLGEVRVK